MHVALASSHMLTAASRPYTKWSRSSHNMLQVTCLGAALADDRQALIASDCRQWRPDRVFAFDLLHTWQHLTDGLVETGAHSERHACATDC